MTRSVLGGPRAKTISIVLIGMFIVGMNPPVINYFNEATTTAGFGTLYLWLSVMAIFVSIALLWAASRDAFALTEDQVPPELRRQEDITTQSDRSELADHDERQATRGDP